MLVLVLFIQSAFDFSLRVFEHIFIQIEKHCSLELEFKSYIF